MRADKKDKFFETSFDCKSGESDDFTEQKLQYLHSNPTKGKWKPVENFIDYKHSSVRYYNVGEQGVFEVTEYKSLGDE